MSMSLRIRIMRWHYILYIRIGHGVKCVRYVLVRWMQRSASIKFINRMIFELSASAPSRRRQATADGFSVSAVRVLGTVQVQKSNSPELNAEEIIFTLKVHQRPYCRRFQTIHRHFIHGRYRLPAWFAQFSICALCECLRKRIDRLFSVRIAIFKYSISSEVSTSNRNSFRIYERMPGTPIVCL